jgi:7-cyano-7-deazaguanine reductase
MGVVMTEKLNFEISELGKKSAYDTSYNPDKLFCIPRDNNRSEIGISGAALPFYGFDQWNHYEVSWLNERGKPMVAVAEISYRCDSPYLIESKSMKLYFNTFNNTKFKDLKTVRETIMRDLSERIGAPVYVNIKLVDPFLEEHPYKRFVGTCLDDLDIACDIYCVEPNHLTTESLHVEEVLYSHLLKSNCLVTYQPDWGSIQIKYRGKKINHEGLLKYIVSYRNHNEFHEQCIERIFVDIMNRCHPDSLTVYGRYTRRGGLDINPYRSTESDLNDTVFEHRLYRQ